MPPTYDGLSPEAVHAVAGLFRATAIIEPYSPDGTEVYRLTAGGAADGVTILLWPSLARVDVTSVGNHGWVMKNVGRVEVVPGVEVVFRGTEDSGFLFVSINGWVNMVVG